MKTSITARHMPLTVKLGRYAEDKIGLVVERLVGGPAARLDIELSQMGHVADGRNMRCRARVAVPRGRQLVVWLRDDDMYKAIDRVHDALVNAVKREVRRHARAAMARRLARRRRSDRGHAPWSLAGALPAMG